MSEVETGFVSYVARAPGGEFNPEEMELYLVAVLVSSNDNVYFFEKGSFDRAVDLLNKLGRVVGVSDLFVSLLGEHGELDTAFVGLQGMLSDALGERVSLGNAARKTLGRDRPEMAVLPLEWEEGNREYVKRELVDDVSLLRDLYLRIVSDGEVWVTHPESLDETRVEISV